MTLPDSAMQGAAEAIINLLGTSTTFYRWNGTAWASNETAVMYKNVRNSEYLRAVSGVGDWNDYTCMVPEGSDVAKGDRVAISGVYWEVDNLNDIGTHIEFGLKETKVAST